MQTLRHIALVPALVLASACTPLELTLTADDEDELQTDSANDAKPREAGRPRSDASLEDAGTRPANPDPDDGDDGTEEDELPPATADDAGAPPDRTDAANAAPGSRDAAVPDARAPTLRDGGTSEPLARDASSNSVDAEAPPPPARMGGHGWNDVPGSSFGNPVSVAGFRKSMTARITGDTRFRAGRAFLLRAGAQENANTWAIIEVTNTSSEVRCGIEAVVTWQDSAGKYVRGLAEADPLCGSNRSSGGSPATASCLGPQELGYMMTVQGMGTATPALIDAVSQLELAMESASSSGYTEPGYKLVPQSYSFPTSGMAVRWINTGTVDAPITDESRTVYLVLDAQGMPLGAAYGGLRGTARIGPGEAIVDTTYIPFVAGTSAKVRAIVRSH